MDKLFGYQSPHSGYTAFTSWQGYYWVEHIVGWNQNFNDDLSQWDTSRVTSMVSIFEKASAFASDLSSWNTSQVTSLDRMFYSSLSFNSILSTWNTSQVTSMHSMFYSSSSFNSPLSSWDISRVTSITSMFQFATAFNQTLCWDVSNVIFDINSANAYNGMFDGSPGSLDQNCLYPHYAMTDSVIQLASYQWATKNWYAMAMYGNIWNWDTTRVTNMDKLFGYQNPHSGYGNRFSAYSVKRS